MWTAAGLAVPWIPERVYSFATPGLVPWNEAGANPIADIRGLVLGMPQVEFAPLLPGGGHGPFHSLGVLDGQSLADTIRAVDSMTAPGRVRAHLLSDLGVDVTYEPKRGSNGWKVTP